VGSAREWAACGSAAVALLAAYVVAGAVGPAGKPPAQAAVAAAAPREIASAARPAAEAPATAEAPAPAAPAVAAEAPAPAASEPAVQITNDMIDKYLAQMPAAADVDLTGVTPIRWDSDEATGKDNPQNAPAPEKIDPVKLDAALLKDLQEAKKKKDESGGKEGGVDIAVMSDKGDTKVKGKEGGKDGGESLANAVSRDPRGQPSRLAARPVPKGVQVRSFARTDSRRKGEERPMGLPDFLSALEQLKAAPQPAAAADGTPADQPAGDRVVRPEPMHPAAASLAEEYFGQLRKADR
jgi:hypothetical protein